MNFLTLFQPKRYIKSVAIYISEKHSEIIFAPLSQEGKLGIIFEQEHCEIIPFNSTCKIIGEVTKRNYNLFTLSKNRTVTGKVKDWPALRASKEKTKVAFEKNYRRISVSGANEFNIIFNIETSLQNLSQLEITSAISAYCDNTDLGKRILAIYNSEICERENNIH